MEKGARITPKFIEKISLGYHCERRALEVIIDKCPKEVMKESGMLLLIKNMEDKDMACKLLEAGADVNAITYIIIIIIIINITINLLHFDSFYRMEKLRYSH